MKTETNNYPPSNISVRQVFTKTKNYVCMTENKNNICITQISNISMTQISNICATQIAVD